MKKGIMFEWQVSPNKKNGCLQGLFHANVCGAETEPPKCFCAFVALVVLAETLPMPTKKAERCGE